VPKGRQRAVDERDDDAAEDDEDDKREESGDAAKRRIGELAEFAGPDLFGCNVCQVALTIENSGGRRSTSISRPSLARY
jgi:hypothetical protein